MIEVFKLLDLNINNVFWMFVGIGIGALGAILLLNLYTYIYYRFIYESRQRAIAESTIQEQTEEDGRTKSLDEFISDSSDTIVSQNDSNREFIGEYPI